MKPQTFFFVEISGRRRGASRRAGAGGELRRRRLRQQADAERRRRGRLGPGRRQNGAARFAARALGHRRRPPRPRLRPGRLPLAAAGGRGLGHRLVPSFFCFFFFCLVFLRFFVRKHRANWVRIEFRRRDSLFFLAATGGRGLDYRVVPSLFCLFVFFLVLLLSKEKPFFFLAATGGRGLGCLLSHRLPSFTQLFFLTVWNAETQ